MNANNFHRNTDKTEIVVFFFFICKLCSLCSPNLQNHLAEPSPGFEFQFSFLVWTQLHTYLQMCAVLVSSPDSTVGLNYFHNALQKILLNHDNLEILFDSSFLFDSYITQRQKTLGQF